MHVLAKKTMNRFAQLKSIVSDRLPSYLVALQMIGIDSFQKTGRWINNHAENFHLIFRRREYAMIKFSECEDYGNWRRFTRQFTMISAKNVIIID